MGRNSLEEGGQKGSKGLKACRVWTRSTGSGGLWKPSEQGPMDSELALTFILSPTHTSHAAWLLGQPVASSEYRLLSTRTALCVLC